MAVTVAREPEEGRVARLLLVENPSVCRGRGYGLAGPEGPGVAFYNVRKP